MSKIEVISDPKIVQRLESIIENLVAEPWYLDPDWVAQRQWIAVPAEKGRHFEEDEAVKVARALQNLGYTECFAVATEPMGDYPHCYRIPATKEGLLDFSQECAGLNFVLMPEDLSCVILCTSEDYNIYAGTPGFVESALGTDISTARARFRAIASDEWWEGRLWEVAKRYEAISSRKDNIL